MDWFISLGIFSLPSIIVRLVMSKDRSFVGFLQDLVGGTLLGCFARIAPWVIPIFQLLIFYDGWISKKITFRLDLSCFNFLPQLKDFKDSAKDLGVFQISPLFFIGSLPSFFAKPLPMEFLILGFPFLYFRTHLARDQLLILWAKQLLGLVVARFKKRGNHDYTTFVKEELLSPQESYKLKDPRYPLFRYTRGFKGEKVFDIPMEKPHVMFLNIESFRAKDFGAMGSDKGVTPSLDTLAKKSLLFNRFYSNSFPTFRSFYTMLSGIPYLVGMKTVLDVNLPLCGIPSLMEENGYETNYFTGADWGVGGLRPFFIQNGATRVYDRREVLLHSPHAEGGSWGLHDEHLLDMTLDHFEKNRETPQFYNILTSTTHHPWVVPKHHIPPSLDQVDNERYKRYLQTLHYGDAQVGRFLQELEKKNLTENLLLFVMGDHGFSIPGENDFTDHLGYGKDDFFHVPLMIYAGDRITDPKVIETLSSQCDLTSTLMDILNIKGYQHSIGRSLMRVGGDRRIFFHNPLEARGSLFVKDNEEHGEFSKSTKEFTGSNPDLHPVLETFEGFLESIYDKKLIAPESFQKNERNLSIEPFRLLPSLPKEELEETIYKRSPLTTLFLNNNSQINDELLTKIATWNPDLERLHIKESYTITDDTLKKVFGKCRLLYELNVSSCYLLTEKCLEYFSESLLQLIMAGLDFVSDDHFNRPLKYLEKLSIRNTPITKKGLRRFPKLFPSLFNLTLSYTNMDIEAIETLLENMPIRYLTIGEGERLSGGDALKLFRKHPTLEYLALHSCTQLTDDIFEAIEETDLLELHLENVPHLSDRGLEALLNLSIKGLVIGGAPNLSKDAFRLLDHYKDKFHNLSVKVLNM